MKKLLLLMLTVLVLFTSCQSSVRVSYMVPSEIDMGQHREIALSSCVPDRSFPRPSTYIWTDGIFGDGFSYISSGYNYALKDDMATYATNAIYNTLTQSGYFTVLDSRTTDRVLNSLNPNQEFRNNGIKAVIVPRIEDMDVDECIIAREYTEKRRDSYGREYEVVDYKYYYDADYYLKISYSIVDTATERIIATRTFEKTDSDYIQLYNPYLSYSYPERAFKRMIDSIQSQITRQLIPLRRSDSVVLVENKPKSQIAESAFKEVNNGNYRSAANLFLDAYNNEGHISSGINASICFAGIGDMQKAIETAKDVVDKYGNEQARVLYARLNEYQRSNEESQRQLEGRPAENAVSNFEYTQGGTIYDALRR